MRMSSQATTPYPWRRVPRLAMRVRYAQHDAAHRELDVLLDEIQLEHAGRRDLSQRKLRCGMVMSYCLRGARLGGATSDPILANTMDAVDALARKRSWPNVRALMHEFIEQMMLQVSPRRQSPMARMVGRIQRELINNPDQVDTLSSYAASAGVRPEVLSRQFRRITGQTFCDARRSGRMARAKHLLVATTASVAEVARRVGMQDVSQFIALFRHEFGQTPARYRQGDAFVQ